MLAICKRQWLIILVMCLTALTVVIYRLHTVASDQVIISLTPEDNQVVDLGRGIYAQHCSSCHGVKLQGQLNWRTPDQNGRMPAPPHDATGHTWHHPDSYLFLMTKYGIEKVIEKSYPNNMPAYKDQLSDEAIMAVLSYIKSTWPAPIQRQHDQINARDKVQKKQGS